MGDLIEPFHLHVPQPDLDDLHQRLSRTRWPDRETVPGTEQGARLDAVQALCEHWRTAYDWRRCEAMLNGFGQFRTAIDGLPIHFLHVRSPEPDALPLVMTHGWPGSVVEFQKVIGPLTDPAAHGGRAADAFHLVLPSLPGYGFSGKPDAPGWGVVRIAAAWDTLMRRLGYARYGAQGGDWGAAVTTAIGVQRPAGCIGLHLTAAMFAPTEDEVAEATPEEQGMIRRSQRFRADGSGYSRQQSTRPQTLGYGLADSPAGQAAWIYEKLHEWTQHDGAPEQVLSHDEMLDNIMLYWLPNAGASSARLYWESLSIASRWPVLDLPVGLSLFPGELRHVSRRWAERRYARLVHWSQPERGGHFAAFEQPELLVREVRDCFRGLR